VRDFALYFRQASEIWRNFDFLEFIIVRHYSANKRKQVIIGACAPCVAVGTRRFGIFRERRQPDINHIAPRFQLGYVFVSHADLSHSLGEIKSIIESALCKRLVFENFFHQRGLLGFRQGVGQYRHYVDVLARRLGALEIHKYSAFRIPAPFLRGLYDCARLRQIFVGLFRISHIAHKVGGVAQSICQVQCRDCRTGSCAFRRHALVPARRIFAFCFRVGSTPIHKIPEFDTRLQYPRILVDLL